MSMYVVSANNSDAYTRYQSFIAANFDKTTSIHRIFLTRINWSWPPNCIHRYLQLAVLRPWLPILPSCCGLDGNTWCQRNPQDWGFRGAWDRLFSRNVYPLDGDIYFFGNRSMSIYNPMFKGESPASHGSAMYNWGLFIINRGEWRHPRGICDVGHLIIPIWLGLAVPDDSVRMFGLHKKCTQTDWSLLHLAYQ